MRPTRLPALLGYPPESAFARRCRLVESTPWLKRTAACRWLAGLGLWLRWHRARLCGDQKTMARVAGSAINANYLAEALTEVKWARRRANAS